jgi:hypothetical protein
MYCAPQAIWKIPRPSSSALLHKNVYRNYKISETVNDLDSDGSSFTELSDSDTCTEEYILIIRNKKFIFDNHTHEHNAQVFSAGLMEFVSYYSHPIRSFCSNVST